MIVASTLREEAADEWRDRLPNRLLSGLYVEGPICATYVIFVPSQVMKVRYSSATSCGVATPNVYVQLLEDVAAGYRAAVLA